MKANKNLFLVIGLVALLVVVAIINYNLSSGDGVQSVEDSTIDDGIKSTDLELPVISSGDSLADYKLEREVIREKEIEYLDDIIDNEKTDAEVLNEAQMQKINITRNMELELTIEGLIKAKGYDEAIVTVQASSVNVVVRAESLDEVEAAEILDIVKTETSQPASNIKIMPEG